MSSAKQFNFRKAEKADMQVVMDMIQELADFENMSDGPKLKAGDLQRDCGLDGGPECCHAYILDLIEGQNALTIGYAICYFSYSTWQGRTYFLEDIYVRQAYRGIGAGSRIFREVATKAKELQCKRVDFHVLSWNPATKFYKKMGAIDLTETEQWHFYRLGAKETATLAQQIKNQ